MGISSKCLDVLFVDGLELRNKFPLRMHIEATEDRTQVVPHGALAEVKPFRDLGHTFTIEQSHRDLPLLRRQLGKSASMCALRARGRGTHARRSENSR